MSMQFIIDYIRASDDVTNEYSLLQFILKTHPEFFSSLGENPSLYKKHFYLFHQLYTLKLAMLETDLSLMISSVEIRICSKKDATNKELSEANGLQEFYLNSDNLHLTDQQINEMLSKFWQKYLAIDKKSQAILMLGLEKEDDLTFTKIKNRFNQLAHQHHPDKGGEKEYFFELKQAYNTLKILY